MTGFAILGWSIIGLGVLAALFFIAFGIKEKNITMLIGGAILSIVASILIWMVFFCIASALENEDDVVEFLDYKQSIYALEDSQKQSASRYVIRNNNAYYFMVKNENGFYQRSVSTGGTFINETNTDEPSILFYKKNHTGKFVKWFYGVTFSSGKVVINVPKGTVSTEFNVDLK